MILLHYSQTGQDNSQPSGRLHNWDFLANLVAFEHDWRCQHLFSIFCNQSFVNFDNLSIKRLSQQVSNPIVLLHSYQHLALFILSWLPNQIGGYVVVPVPFTFCHLQNSNCHTFWLHDVDLPYPLALLSSCIPGQVSWIIAFPLLNVIPFCLSFPNPSRNSW